jgi:hypothetical protein
LFFSLIVVIRIDRIGEYKKKKEKEIDWIIKIKNRWK